MPRTLPNPRTTRIAALTLGLALFGAACAANGLPPPVKVQQGGSLVTQIPDSLNDAGRAASVALDAKGNVSIVYLLLTPKLKPGVLPPAVVAGQPQPPAVILAAQADGVWTRTSITKQSTNPARGEAPGIATKDGTAGPAVHTGLVVDGQDKHHVAWSSAVGVFYATDAGGSFGEPEKVVDGPTFGASLALGADGSPWIAFYQGDELKVATKAGSGWVTETAATGVATSGAAAVVTAIGLAPSGEPVVAFGNGPQTLVASRSGKTWSTDPVPGDGGYGVSMVVDANGGLHLAYLDAGGVVHHAHRMAGAPWEVTDVASMDVSGGTPDPSWGTGIAVDGQGTRYVTWADVTKKEIMLATGTGGSFRPEVVPSSEGGAAPAVAVAPDGKQVAVAWYDTVNGNLEVATPAERGQAIAFSPQPASPAPSAPPTGAATCKPDGTTVTVVAKNISFDKDCLAAPAEKPFTLVMENEDPGTPHNVEIFKSSAATDRLGGAKDATDFVLGPEKATYQVDALPKGDYFFRCDIHPTQMTGTFVVA